MNCIPIASLLPWWYSIEWLAMSLFPLFSSKITLHSIEYALESYWFPSSLLIFHWLPINIKVSLNCRSIYCIQLNMNWIPIASLLPWWYSIEWLAMSLFPLFSIVKSHCIQLNMKYKLDYSYWFPSSLVISLWTMINVYALKSYWFLHLWWYSIGYPAAPLFSSKINFHWVISNIIISLVFQWNHIAFNLTCIGFLLILFFSSDIPLVANQYHRLP